MKKINWGTGIAAFYSVFAAAMIFLVIKSIYNPSILMKKNYYDDDIYYQANLTKAMNGTKLGNDMTIQYIAEANTIILQFPDNLPAPVGRVTFFRPSDDKQDRIIELKTDVNKRMFIQIEDFQKGLWRIQVEWQAEDKSYFKEEKIYLEPNNWARPVHENK